MSESWHHARALAERLKADLPEESPIDAAATARFEQALVEALQSRRSSRARRRVAAATGVVLVAAAAALLALAEWSPRVHSSQPIARAPSVMLLRGELVRQDGSVVERAPRLPGAWPAAGVLRSGPSTIVRTGSDSQVELRHALVVVESVGKTAAFVLESGSLLATAHDVDQSVVIDMADVRIEGRGAVFEVERSGGSCGRPAVQVRSGQVTVSSGAVQHTVVPGASWSSCPEPGVSVAGAINAPRTNERATTTSSLQEQNEALAEAVSARRAERRADALRLYGAFLKRWPSSPLAEVARADRMNLLATQDPEAARRAAREYLQRHPNGPAHERARTLAGER